MLITKTSRHPQVFFCPWMRHATSFQHVHLKSAGLHLPGAPIDNDDMDAYIAPLNRASARIKQRYYAIDTEGKTTISNAALAARAVEDCLRRGQLAPGEV